MPNDQHLQTTEGDNLCDNDATLGDLAILPDSLILAKVSFLKMSYILNRKIETFASDSHSMYDRFYSRP